MSLSFNYTITNLIFLQIIFFYIIFFTKRIRNNSLSPNKLRSIKQVFEVQVKEEKINIIKAEYNTLLFCINALKKYYL